MPIVLFGAQNSEVKGTYEPVDEIHEGWPVYSLRGNRDVWMVLVGDEWLIQRTKDKGQAPKALVRMSCVPHCWPELRTDGTNGIVEYNELMGIFTPLILQRKSQIIIITEAEASGSRASEMFKLAELSDAPSGSEAVTAELVERKSSSSVSRPHVGHEEPLLVNHDPEDDEDTSQPAPFSIVY